MFVGLNGQWICCMAVVLKLFKLLCGGSHTVYFSNIVSLEGQIDAMIYQGTTDPSWEQLLCRIIF